ncbi:MAG: hypothetical protein AB2A00_02160 [Myxococcota bacterium]
MFPALLLLHALHAPAAMASVEIVWQGPEDEWPRVGPATALPDEDVWLSALVRFADGTCAVRTGAYVDATGVTRLCDTGLERLSDLRATWLKLEPAESRMARSPRGLGPPLPFRATAFATLHADRPLLADARPALAPDDEGAEVGAMRYVVRISDERAGGESWESPGLTEAREAFLLKVRADDDYVGVLEELRHVTHADSPRGVPVTQHETELALAVDGMTLPVYGARRLGLALPYVDLDLLGAHLQPVPLDQVQRGDIIQQGPRVGVLASDGGVRGTLDAGDELLTASSGPLRRERYAKDAGETRAWRIKDLPARLPPRPTQRAPTRGRPARPDAGPRGAPHR